MGRMGGRIMRTKKNSIVILLICTILLIHLPGCGQASLPDVYGPDSVVYGAPYLDKDPGPTERVKAKEEKYLRKQTEKVKTFWEENRSLLDEAASQLWSTYTGPWERTYYYEIAERNLITTFALPTDDADAAKQYESLEKTLNRVSDLRHADYFERIYINSKMPYDPFCELTGALKLYDGIGCYVSLAYFPKVVPRFNQFSDETVEVQMLDEQWALIIAQKIRDSNGKTLPRQKVHEVVVANQEKQAWELYRYWQENQKQLEEISVKMIDLCIQNPGYSFSYAIKWDHFYGTPAFDDRPDKDDAASPELLEDLRAFSLSSDPPAFQDIGATIKSLGTYICEFSSPPQYADGYIYQSVLYYESGDSQDEQDPFPRFIEIVELDEHWRIARIPIGE